MAVSEKVLRQLIQIYIELKERNDIRANAISSVLPELESTVLNMGYAFSAEYEDAKRQAAL